MEQVFELRAKITWEEAVSRGQELREQKDNSQWDLGDLALEVNNVYGQDSLGKFSNDIGINKKSMYQYRRISVAFPKESRNKYLSHRHHMMLAPRKDRFTWLTKANDNNWTVSQLERELAIADGKTPRDMEPTPNTVRCDTCHKWKLETDDVCHCYKYWEEL